MRARPYLLSLLFAAGAALAQDGAATKPTAREAPKGRLASPPVSVPPVRVPQSNWPTITPMTPVPPLQVRPMEPMSAVPPMQVQPLPPAAPVVPLQQVQPPPVVTSCDAGGCWSSDGTRLNRVGPNLMGPGGVCTVTGKMVHCP
jgi:hypothetical protein